MPTGLGPGPIGILSIVNVIFHIINRIKNMYNYHCSFNKNFQLTVHITLQQVWLCILLPRNISRWQGTARKHYPPDINTSYVDNMRCWGDRMVARSRLCLATADQNLECSQSRNVVPTGCLCVIQTNM